MSTQELNEIEKLYKQHQAIFEQSLDLNFMSDEWDECQTQMDELTAEILTHLPDMIAALREMMVKA